MTTPGKYRHLSRCANADGHFVVLAIDHRANLLGALNQYAPQPVNDAEFLAFKQAILATTALAPAVSAVLTDPAYGIAAGITQGHLTGRLGLLAPLEVTNYDVAPNQRGVQFIPGWSVRKIKLAGGDGVKLLLFYHPDAPDAAEKQAIVRQIVDECGRYDIPFFLEPITYSPDPSQPLGSAELLQVTLMMARLFSDLGADVLKLHFPIDVQQTPDAAEWQAACKKVSHAARVPWTLLSAGAAYDDFLRQAQTACAAGASGVIVGRAVWNEAVQLQGDERARFLNATVPQRLRALAEVCAAHAQPWMSRVASPSAALNWFEQYGE